jgi:hypothetical protein
MPVVFAIIRLSLEESGGRSLRPRDLGRQQALRPKRAKSARFNIPIFYNRRAACFAGSFAFILEKLRVERSKRPAFASILFKISEANRARLHCRPEACDAPSAVLALSPREAGLFADSPSEGEDSGAVKFKLSSHCLPVLTVKVLYR